MKERDRGSEIGDQWKRKKVTADSSQRKVKNLLNIDL